MQAYTGHADKCIPAAVICVDCSLDASFISGTVSAQYAEQLYGICPFFASNIFGNFLANSRGSFNLATFELSLKRQRRRALYDLFNFFDVVSVYLMVGYDLSFSWPQVIRVIASQMKSQVLSDLSPKEQESMGTCLKRLSSSFQIEPYRIWFSILKELYEKGAGLVEPMGAIAASLRSDYLRDLETHSRTLPTKIQILLLIFFLPPALLVLFVPLLVEVSSILK